MTDHLRTRIIAAIAKADQDWFSDNPLYEDMADSVIDLLIDMAGQGELLKEIDMMHREPRSAEKLGLTGDGR